MVVVRRSYSHYCSRVVHQRMMGWIEVKFAPHRLLQYSLLWAKCTVVYILEVLAVSNAYYHVHFYSIDHDDDHYCCHDNTDVHVEDYLDNCFPCCLVVPDHTHAEVSSMSMIVYYSHCCSTDQDSLYWNHDDTAPAEEDLDHC
jgi:hypothetical protein